MADMATRDQIHGNGAGRQHEALQYQQRAHIMRDSKGGGHHVEDRREMVSHGIHGCRPNQSAPHVAVLQDGVDLLIVDAEIKRMGHKGVMPRYGE